MMQKKEIIALALALVACLLWSGNFVTARGVHEWIPPLALAFWRWTVAVLVVAPFGLPHLLRQWPLVRQHWKYLFVMGAASVGAYNTLIYLASSHTTSHHLALISSTAPIWTLLLAGLLGTERLSRYKLGGAAFAFAGALVIVTHGELGKLFAVEWNHGDRLILLAAWIWAGYCVMLHYKPKEMHQLTFLTAIFVVGLTCIAPFYAWEVASGRPTPFTAQAWAAYTYVGIASSVLAWFAWNNAVQAIGSVKAGLVYYMIPVFSGVLAVIFLDEPPALYHVAGFLLIFTGIVVSNLRKLGLTKSDVTQP